MLAVLLLYWSPRRRHSILLVVCHGRLTKGKGQSGEGSEELDESSAVRAGWQSNAGVIEKRCYQHTRACPSEVDERDLQRWGPRLSPPLGLGWPGLF